MNRVDAKRRGDLTHRTPWAHDGARSGTAGLKGTRLVVARALWLALVTVVLGLFAASLPVYFALLQRPCGDPVTCNIAGALSAQGLSQLPSLGLSPGAYATLLTIFFTAIVAFWSGVGFLIFWRRSNDGFALFTAFFLVIFNTAYPGFTLSALALAFPAFSGLVTVLGATSLASIISFLILFPNGRLVPRWMGIVLVLAIVGAITNALPNSPANSDTWPWWLGALFNIPQYAAIIFSQVYRYRRVSTRVERQQTKWVVFGIVVAMAGITAVPFATNLLPATFNLPNTPLNAILGVVTYPILLLSLPVTIGIAILRSHLYDIDVLINRTLVYGTLTILLAGVYVGLILGLEAFMRLFNGQGGQSPIAITISTLAIAALFQPLRHRLQTTIDHRFYRHKYDATRTLARFSASLRGEVELNELGEQLARVVQETMQPAHLSLWLRPTTTRPSSGKQ